jgi:hypothetical protein
VVLLALGLFSGGGVAGWTAANRYADRSAPPVALKVDAEAATAGGPLMADVRGLTADEAKQVLADLGLGVTEVTTREAPSIGRPGTVVAQTPPAGQPASAKVELVLAAAAVIPKVVGTPVAQATRDLEQLGAHVVVDRVYRKGATVDNVLSVKPAAGSPAIANVVLTVAAPPAAVNLADLRAVAGGCSSGDYTVNGVAHPHSLACSAYTTVSETAYLLNRRTVELHAVLGQNDQGTPGTRVRFTILGDGKTLASATLAYGAAKEIQANTTGVLRLTLRVQLIGTTGSATAVFGEIRAVGGPADVVALTETGQ